MRFLRTATAALLLGCLAACGEAGDEVAAPARPAGTAAEAEDVVAAIRRLPEFSGMTLMLEASGVGPELAAAPSITLLAVRDTGLAELPPRTVDAMMAPAYAATLSGQLRSLALPRLLTAAELRTEIDAAGGTLVQRSLAGTALSFARDGDLIIVTAPDGSRASMGSLEIGAGNGAVYVLDHWLGGTPSPLPAPSTPPQRN